MPTCVRIHVLRNRCWSLTWARPHPTFSMRTYVRSAHKNNLLEVSRMRRFITGMTVLALVGAGAGCGSSSDGGSTTTEGGVDQVKVGVIPIVDVAPIYLGQKKGFFGNRKIELTMESGQ